VIGLIPSLLLLAPLLVGILLNLVLILGDRSASSTPSFMFLAGTAAGLVLLICSAILAVGAVSSRIRSGLLRFVLLYGANLIIVFIVIWLFVRMIGGASMAVVDGVVPPGELRRASLSAALPLLGIAQLVIIPWVLIAVIILRRKNFTGMASA
jgi:uncharacterized membrane protein